MQISEAQSKAAGQFVDLVATKLGCTAQYLLQWLHNYQEKALVQIEVDKVGKSIKTGK